MDKDNTILLGIDSSSISTGWAIGDMNGKLIKYGSINPRGIIEEKLLITVNELNKILNEYKPTFVAIEDVNCFTNPKTAKLLAEFVGVIRLTCYMFNGNEMMFYPSTSLKAIVGVNPRELKKQGITGIGVKDEVVKAVQKLYNIDIPLDKTNHYRDVADAISVFKKLYEELKQGELYER